MCMQDESTTIKHEMAFCLGPEGDCAVTLFIYPDSEETEIVVRKSYLQRFKLREHKKAMKLFEELNGAGKIIDLDLLADIVKHRKAIK